MIFIKKIAAIIAQNETVPTQETLVVVPNKRAKQMIRMALAQELKKTFFSPVIFSIDEFVHTLSPYKQLSDIELQVELYYLCRAQNFPRCADFNQFLNWAPAFLNDINEIDMQLTNVEAIFTNIMQIKEIEEIFTDRNSEYLRFYEMLYSLYKSFNQQLKEKKCAYNGAIYRDEAAHIAEYAVAALPYKRSIFAGFNTLSPAEIEILKWLYQNRSVELYFDLDNFYEQHFLDKFIKPIQKELQIAEIKTIGNDYATIHKQISLIGVAKTTTQLLCAIEKIHEIERQQGHLNDTALVLADEQMILPFVHLYDCTNANLTMGYPFAATPAADLINDWFKLYINALQFREAQHGNSPLFYTKELYSFLHNPILQEVITDTGAIALAQLQRRRLLFMPLNEIEEQIAQWLPNTTTQFSVMQKFINFIAQVLNAMSPDFTYSTMIQLLLENVQNLAGQLSNYAETLDIQALYYLVKMQMNALSIPFRGDFAHGLQVMGLLETRMLDFKNVIVVGMNEGNLPKGRSHNTLLLYDVKRHFNLPSEQYKESIFACHFFHLLQRAEHITLIYDTDSEDKLSEPSRFISQLQYEIKARGLQHNITVTEEHLSILPKLNSSENEIQIIKNERIIEKIKTLSLSASALNCYIQCPLKFYLQYVEKLSCPQVSVEPLQANVVGSIFHRIVEKVLNGYLAAYDQSSYIQEFTKDLTIHITQAMNGQPELEGADFSQGKYYMVSRILDKMLRDYLRCIPAELSRARIIGVEIHLNHTLVVSESSIHLKGIADRVEEKGGVITVLDYKTGNIESRDLEYKDMSKLFGNMKFAKLFQLLFYAYLYQKDRSISFKTECLRAGIVSVREAVSGSSDYFIMASDFPTDDATLITQELLHEFEENLIQLIDNMLDSTIPFQQTTQEENCKYCDFKMICCRVL
jgi:CRISPR/Cas system-associated exonuclease Cas4 (RecB family)